MAETILPEGAGYGIVIGVGCFFTLFMLGISWLQARYTEYSPNHAVEFNSASRSVKPGLIAAGVVSAWTWAATLLQSSTIAYKYGISGPYWYAAGATVQVLVMAQNSAKLKLNAPTANTFLQPVKVRWGTAMHLTCMFFGFVTNFLVSSMLIVGSSDTVHSLTGMSVYAACFLIPATVVGYVVVGGMRATLLCDYTHTSVLFVVILFLMFTVYGASDKIGSPDRMWELLQEAAAKNPVINNAGGSYVTFRSKGAIIFGVINITGNFATVFLDQAYWQRAIASQTRSSVKAFIAGGMLWFAIPMGFASCMGLTSIALSGNADYPGYPNLLTADQVNAGLAAPYGVTALLGKSGATLILVLLFLAVTSASSAELIAVSSILTYDIYGTYIRPKATDKQLMLVSHLGVCFWGLCMAIFGIMFYEIGISLGWLFEFVGCVLGACAPIVCLAMRSRSASKWWCFAAIWVGTACAMASWLAVAGSLNHGEISVETTGQNYPMLAGSVVGGTISFIIALIGMWVHPEQYDFSAMKAIGQSQLVQGEEPGHTRPTRPDMESKGSEDEIDVPAKDPAKTAMAADDQRKSSPSVNSISSEDAEERSFLQKSFVRSVWVSLVLCTILVVIIPLPIFFSSVVYGKGGFTTWISLVIAWLLVAACGCILYPIWESRAALMQIVNGIYNDLRGKRPV
jgi:SSS family transporter